MLCLQVWQHRSLRWTVAWLCKPCFLQCPLVGYADLLLVLQQLVLWQLVLPQLLQLVLLLLLVQLWQKARWRFRREWFPMCA